MTKQDKETVLVIGAGIAGLCVALALGPTGRQVTLLERDDTPPSGDADEAFRDWQRRGVGHLRQSHAFLARLRSLMKNEHPALLQELLDSGCREIGFKDMLADNLKAGYQPLPGDAELAVLTSRRTTLELVMRRYVERLPNVAIASGVFVKSLILNKNTDGAIIVEGVVCDEGGVEREIRADMVVDAAGKNDSCVEQLVAAGAPITEESETAGILYFTRHYRLRPGVSEPPRGKAPATGDLGFLKFGVFPADNGCFSITVCVPEIEMEMRQAVVNPELFDGICRQMPGLVPWLDPATSEPVSKVFGMGDLQSRWRHLYKDGAPAALGFFALGDAVVRTNPLYGRGCSFAAVAAYLLRDVLAESAGAAERALAYPTRMETVLRPYYLNMRDQDRGAIRRARQALTPSYRPSFRSKVLKSFLEDGVAIATRSDITLLRAALRGFHMLEHPSAWLRSPSNMAKVVRYWAKSRKAKADAYPPKAGPGRDELMRALGLRPEADIERLAAEGSAA